jgi:hypothetical protein
VLILAVLGVHLKIGFDGSSLGAFKIYLDRIKGVNYDDCWAGLCLWARLRLLILRNLLRLVLFLL